MSKAIWACNPEAGLAAAEAGVREAKLGRLPVIDRSERIIGLPPLADPVSRPGGGSKNPPPMRRVGETSVANRAPGAPRSRPPLPGKAPSVDVTPTASDEGALRKGRGGRLLSPAGRKHHLGPGTVALRWCSGCKRFMGVKLWPRTAHTLVHTHGLCRSCFERILNDVPTDPVLLGEERAGSAGDELPL